MTRRHGTMRDVGQALLVIVLAALGAIAPTAAEAEEWDGIVAGQSTMQTVKTRLGAPTRETTQKLEDRETPQWVYEGPQAPSGIVRLTIDFGLNASSGYRSDVVRSFKVEPRPGAFNREVILQGWGLPTRFSREGDGEVFFYKDGLFVYFDGSGWGVRLLVFTPPQPPPAAPEAPRQP